jgi:hypothetical protein
MAGLDPAIHLLRKDFLRRMMDPRVKPAGDVPGSADKSSSLRKLDGVPGKVSQNLGRHGRAWPGHPRLS